MAALHAVRSALRDAVRAGLAPVERLALRLGDPLPYAPIFIGSPPRSGSTLLYLLAVQKYRLSYFSNFALACTASPALLTLLGDTFGPCAGGASPHTRFGAPHRWHGPAQGPRARHPGF